MMGVIEMSKSNVSSSLEVLNEIGPIQAKAGRWIGQIGVLGFSFPFLPHTGSDEKEDKRP